MALFGVISIGLPVMAVLVIGVLEPIALGQWRRRFVELGWDLCVVAVGVIGGIASAQSVRSRYEEDLIILLVVGAILITVACVALIAKAKTSEHPRGWQALASIGLGLVSLALPCRLAFG